MAIRVSWLYVIAVASIVSAAAQAQATWKLGSQPRVAIGSATGGEAFLLGEIVAALPLSDGRIVIADRQVPRLRVFDANGRHVADWGRKGQGPEDFGEITRVFPYRGDSLAVWDAGNFRVSIVAANGTIVRTIRPDATSMYSSPPGMLMSFANVAMFGTLADGRFLLAGAELTPRQIGAQRGHRAVYLIAADGARTDSVGAMEGMEQTIRPNMRPDRDEFWRPPAAAAFRDRIFYGNADQFLVRVVDPRFRPITQMRGSTPPVAITDQLRRDHERALADRRSVGRISEGPSRAVTYPQTLPAFSDIRVSADGFIWVQWHWPAQEVFSIFSPEGKEVAQLTMRSGMRLMFATGAQVYVTDTDADGVPRVLVYDFTRG